jgi:hypothetical protein
MPRLHVIVQRYVPRWVIEVALVAAALQIYRQTLHLRTRFLDHPIMVRRPERLDPARALTVVRMRAVVVREDNARIKPCTTYRVLRLVARGAACPSRPVALLISAPQMRSADYGHAVALVGVPHCCVEMVRAS